MRKGPEFKIIGDASFEDKEKNKKIKKDKS